MGVCILSKRLIAALRATATVLQPEEKERETAQGGKQHELLNEMQIFSYDGISILTANSVVLMMQGSCVPQ
jgi:hypothetical protein